MDFSWKARFLRAFKEVTLKRNIFALLMLFVVINIAGYLLVNFYYSYVQTGPMPFTQKAFTAVYKWRNTPDLWQVSSNGQGQTRSEYISGNNQNNVTINDFNTGKSYQFNPDTKSGFWSGMKDGTNVALSDEEWIKANQKDLLIMFGGEKIIDGHKCRGWLQKTPDGKTLELWFGDDTGCVVYSAYKPFWEQHLVKYGPEPLAKQMFEIPNYCKAL